VRKVIHSTSQSWVSVERNYSDSTVCADSDQVLISTTPVESGEVGKVVLLRYHLVLHAIVCDGSDLAVLKTIGGNIRNEKTLAWTTCPTDSCVHDEGNDSFTSFHEFRRCVFKQMSSRSAASQRAGEALQEVSALIMTAAWAQ